MENPKILIIDDSPSILVIYKELLQEFNARTDFAADGQEGLEKARAHNYDLIITDVEMPRMDGIELCRRLDADLNHDRIPIIIVSAFNSEADIERGFEAGATAYLSKQEVPDLLAKTVHEALWKSRQLRQRKIMIVDDSRSIRRFLESGLNGGGFQTICAADGRQALDLLGEEQPDLILTDIDMPVLNGFELCKTVKSDPRFASIPLVVMSTNDDRGKMKRMIQYGAAAYLVKPFNLDQLVLLLEKILSDHFLLLLKERERLDAERSSLLDSITSLISALEARDPYTRGHSEAVSRMTSEMVAFSGASKSDVESVAIGGRLHDIGKIGVRDSVLLKPGRLTEEEYIHIQKHPSVGMQILEPIPSLREVLTIVQYHHERWDGKGYPQGLRQDEIPFWARITAVADTFHALTSDRPYREGMSVAKAFNIIAVERGKQLCPACVDLFFDWVDSKKEGELLY